MSSIHYKFKASLDYKTLTVEGLHISVQDLKREIFEKEKIGQAAFDLELTNAQTRKVYNEDTELIPRNSSVIVARIPAANVKKLPKLNASSGNSDGAISLGGDKYGASSGAFNVSQALSDASSDLTRATSLTEQEKLRMVKDISTAAYAPDKFALIKTGSIPFLLVVVC